MSTAMSRERLEQAQRAARDGLHLRLVRHARLTLAAREDGHAARFALEDALNTADFGDAGRLVIVRRLDLGLLPARASAQHISGLIEKAWRLAARHALSAEDPRSAEAPAVWFDSPLAARLLWLRLTAEDRPRNEWYWRSALPEAAGPAMAPAQAVAAVAGAALAQTPELLVRAIRTWPQAAQGRLAAVLRAQAPAMHEALVSAEPGQPDPGDERHSDGTAAHAAREHAAGGNEDGSPPLRPLPAHAPAQADAPASPPRTVRAAARDAQGLPPSKRIVPAASADAPTAVMPERVCGDEARIAPLPIAAPALPASADAGETASRVPRPRRPPWPWWGQALPTGHGGLLMLIPVLDRLGFDAWLLRQPAALRAALVALVFECVAERCALPQEDPQRPLFALPEDEQAAAAHARCDWSGHTWPAWLAASGAPIRAGSGRRSASRWCAALDRALRRCALELDAVVRRDALVAVTDTHADVAFAADAVDLRLRRQGLDSDPGWVPWLGRIVAFHFNAEASGDA